MIDFIKFLVRPARMFEAPELRRRIVVLNSLMQTYTFFVFIMLMASHFLPGATGEDTFSTEIILGICLAIFSGACALGRTKHYVVGGLLFTITIYAGCAIAPFPRHDVQVLIKVMPFFIVPALLGAFLFPLRVALINFSVGLALSVGLPFYFGLFDVDSRHLFVVLFNVIGCVVLFVGTLLRSWDEQQMIVDRISLVKNSKMQTLGQMAGNIAHEMNTPLGAVILRASQMTRLLARSDDLSAARQQLTTMASDIEKIGKEIARTVEGLQRFARNDEKHVLQPIRLAMAFETTFRICRQKIEGNNIRLEIAPYDQALEVLGSEVQIAQVVLNLLTNAQQAVAQLPEKWIKVSVEETGDRIEIAVTDSGAGIPKDIAAKIFEPFFTTKPIGEGTGLGLSISYGIVGHLGGRLFVDSGCVNTRFVISLPRLLPEGSKQQAAAAG